MAVLNFLPDKSHNNFPAPTNVGLKGLFAGINKILIKEGGVYEDKAMSAEVLLTLTTPEKILQFSQLLVIDENCTGFYCLCSGTYAIELYNDTDLQATIGFHHGVSIRYYKWDGDAALAKSDELLAFFAEEGLTKPLADRIRERERQDAAYISERAWLTAAPKSFSQYVVQMKDFDDYYLPSLLTDLHIEFSNKQQLIISLLQTYGKTENMWSVYPIYEDVPYKLLTTFDVKDITEAYLQSDRNYKTRKGLGRFLCSFNFRKKRKKYLSYITIEIIDDIEKCFEWIKDAHGVHQISKLRKEKTHAMGH